MSVDALLAHVAGADALRRDAFPDLFFRGHRARRPLQVDLRGRRVRWLRLVNRRDAPLGLESIGLLVRRPDGGVRRLRPASFSMSSIAATYGPLERQRAVFDAPGPDAARIRLATQPGRDQRVTIELAAPARALELVVHNRGDRWAGRAWGLAVEVSDDGHHWTEVYSHPARVQAFLARLREMPLDGTLANDVPGGMAVVQALYAHLATDRLDLAKQLLDADTTFSEDERRALKRAFSAGLLAALEREWTAHGVQRSFRYWAMSEKCGYLRRGNEVIADLRAISPRVCYGFGFVLGLLRANDFIPHDDDVDLLLAVPHQPGATLAALRERVRNHLRKRGYQVSGDHFNHVHVGKPGWPHVFDVFVGFVEGDRISWFPSARKGLALATVFPPREIETHGVACPFPADPETYVAATYGPDWRSPDVNFRHPWDRSQFRDLT